MRHRPFIRRGLTSGVFLSMGLAAADVHAQEDPIVYVRCPRTTEALTIPGGGPTFLGLDVYDILPDVVHFFSGFSAPCDLVLRQPAGTEELLYDCTSISNDTQGCAAMDPAVSFDAQRVAFTVFRGPLVHDQEYFSALVGADDAWHDLPGRVLESTEAQLHIVELATGEVTALPSLADTYDAGPAWLPDGRLAFTSNRDGNRITHIFGTGNPGPGSRIWTMDVDGRNLDLASHHSLSMDQHPLVLVDGRVAYSSWQLFGGLPFRHTNGSPGGFTTPENLFHLYTQNPDGAEPFALYGQHSGDHSPTTIGNVSHNAAHFISQTSDGRVWFSDYYRGNNSGLGHLVGVMPEPEGQEGMLDPEAPHADIYAPHDVIRAATWSSNNDRFAAPMPAPTYDHPAYSDPVVFVGKLGHPAALPDNGLMLTWGKGACSTVANDDIFDALGLPVPPGTSGSGSGVAANVFTQLGLDTPACDAGIYEATTIPSVHPSDLELVVDEPQWHEFMARAVVPYSAIHGVERPQERPRADLASSHPELDLGTPFGLLGAASILDRETHPVGGIHFVGEHQFHLQGTDTINYTDDDLCGVRMLGVLPNRGPDTYTELANVAGERVVILGEIGVRNHDDDGAAVLDPSGNPDTSFLLRMPANVPYLMQGIDCEGHTLNTDQSWQSLRPGETKTCGGCHVHSTEARVEFDETFAALSDYSVFHLGEGTVPLLTGAGDPSPTTTTVDGYGLQIDFELDIAPIFEARCNSCHGGMNPAANLALDVPGTDIGSTWHCLVADRAQECVPQGQRMTTTHGTTFRRPQLTRYLRAFNSLGSPLYWKAVGARTDGNTDATFDDASDPDDRDLDFGPAHTTEITDEELRLLSRWIDIGAPGGPGEGIDTQRPTLTLAASTEDETVTALHVGTVDIPSGIDVGSLEVCVLAADGTCGPNLAAAGAEPHGVVELLLESALSDPEIEVRARVLDLAGNETEIRRTVAWLLNSPPPRSPAMTRGGADDTGGSDGTTDGSTGNSSAGTTTGTDTDTAGGADGGGGCGCTAAPSLGTTWWALMLLAGCLPRRRRRPRATAGKRRAATS